MGRKKSFLIWPYLLVAPALAIMIFIVFVPVIQAISISLQSYDLRYPNKIHFIGLENYITLLTKDRQFWHNLSRTLIWVVCGVGFQFLTGFVLALLLNHSFKGRGLVRSLSMMPWVTPGVLIGLIWRWMYDRDYGVINDVLQRLGIINDGIAFLSKSETALGATIVTIVWQGMPFFALMILAALQGVSSDSYEAADIDGASFFQKLFLITIPSIKNTIFTTLLLRIIWVTNSVDIILNMTAGGPAYVTQTIGIDVYNRAHFLDLGSASSMAIILAFLLMLVAVPYLRHAFKSTQ